MPYRAAFTPRDGVYHAVEVREDQTGFLRETIARSACPERHGVYLFGNVGFPLPPDQDEPRPNYCPACSQLAQ